MACYGKLLKQPTCNISTFLRTDWHRSPGLWSGWQVCLGTARRAISPGCSRVSTLTTTGARAGGSDFRHSGGVGWGMSEGQWGCQKYGLWRSCEAMKIMWGWAQTWDSTVFSRCLNKRRQTFKHRGWRSCDLHGFFYVSGWSFCIVQCGRCCSHYIPKGWYESGLLRIHCMSAWQTSSWSTLNFRSRVGQVLMVSMVKWLNL